MSDPEKREALARFLTNWKERHRAESGRSLAEQTKISDRALRTYMNATRFPLSNNVRKLQEYFGLPLKSMLEEGRALAQATAFDPDPKASSAVSCAGGIDPHVARQLGESPASAEEPPACGDAFEGNKVSGEGRTFSDQTGSQSASSSAFGSHPEHIEPAASVENGREADSPPRPTASEPLPIGTPSSKAEEESLLALGPERPVATEPSDPPRQRRTSIRALWTFLGTIVFLIGLQLVPRRELIPINDETPEFECQLQTVFVQPTAPWLGAAVIYLDRWENGGRPFRSRRACLDEARKRHRQSGRILLLHYEKTIEFRKLRPF